MVAYTRGNQPRRGRAVLAGKGLILYPTVFGAGGTSDSQSPTTQVGGPSPTTQVGGFGFLDVASFLGKNVLLPFAKSALSNAAPAVGSAFGQFVGNKIGQKILGRGISGGALVTPKYVNKSGLYIYDQQPAQGTIGAHGNAPPFPVGSPVPLSSTGKTQVGGFGPGGFDKTTKFSDKLSDAKVGAVNAVDKLLENLIVGGITSIPTGAYNAVVSPNKRMTPAVHKKVNAAFKEAARQDGNTRRKNRIVDNVINKNTRDGDPTEKLNYMGSGAGKSRKPAAKGKANSKNKVASKSKNKVASKSKPSGKTKIIDPLIPKTSITKKQIDNLLAVDPRPSDWASPDKASPKDKKKSKAIDDLIIGKGLRFG